MCKGYKKEDFLRAWGRHGYTEDFGAYIKAGYHANLSYFYEKIISEFVNPDHVALEIGCGSGRWSNLLVTRFLKTIAIDVIPRSPKLNKNVIYYELDNYDFKCMPIEDNSINFVFSFGVFCHLPVSAQNEYVHNILRILKPGGNAVIMFADWIASKKTTEEEKDNYKDFKENVMYPGTIQWFYMDKDLIKDIMINNNIKEYKDLLPDFRDRIIHFKK